LGLVVVGLVEGAGLVGVGLVVRFVGLLRPGLEPSPHRKPLLPGGPLKLPPLEHGPVGLEPWVRRWALAATKTMKTLSTSGKSSSNPTPRRPSVVTL
jgi:hypothetical protein